jgi:hypothetical protein
MYIFFFQVDTIGTRAALVEKFSFRSGASLCEIEPDEKKCFGQLFEYFRGQC